MYSAGGILIGEALDYESDRSKYRRYKNTSQGI